MRIMFAKVRKYGVYPSGIEVRRFFKGVEGQRPYDDSKNLSGTHSRLLLKFYGKCRNI